MAKRLRIVWISFFPVEWLSDLPVELRTVPRQHPATWQRVLVEEFRRREDLELHVIAVRKQFPQDCVFQQKGVTYHCLKVPPGMRGLTLFWWETVLIRRKLKALKPDLLHAWGTERGAALVASRCDCPYLVSMQGLLEWYTQVVDLGWHMWLEARLERISLRRAKVVTVESRFGVNWLRERYSQLEIRQVEHAPARLFHGVARRPPTGPLQFLYVGMLSQIKGADLLFRGLDQLYGKLDFRLTVVGSGTADYLEGLRDSTSRELWERVTIKQGLTPSEVAQEMGKATVMLFPTRADNSPNSVKEAAVAGLPVVASATGGIVDYIKDGLNGITFTAGDREAFVAAIQRTVSHPLLGTGKVDVETLRQAREYLSPEAMAEGFWDAYEKARLIKRRA